VLHRYDAGFGFADYAAVENFGRLADLSVSLQPARFAPMVAVPCPSLLCDGTDGYRYEQEAEDEDGERREEISLRGEWVRDFGGGGQA
jgi:hypothetical protein